MAHIAVDELELHRDGASAESAAAATATDGAPLLSHAADPAHESAGMRVGMGWLRGWRLGEGGRVLIERARGAVQLE